MSVMKFDHNAAKRLIVQNGRTRKWIAAQLGLTEGTLRQYLGGNAKPGAETLRKLAKLLEVEIGAIARETK